MCPVPTNDPWFLSHFIYRFTKRNSRQVVRVLLSTVIQNSNVPGVGTPAAGLPVLTILGLHKPVNVLPREESFYTLQVNEFAVLDMGKHS